MNFQEEAGMESRLSIEEKYTRFWNEFKLFPMPWANAMFNRPRWLYGLFFLTYGLFLYGLLIDVPESQSLDLSDPLKIRFWFGSVFVGLAEAHILTLTLLPVAATCVRWAASIPKTLEWLRKPIRRIQAKEGNFDEHYLAYLNQFQKRLLFKWPSAIITVILILLFFLIVFGGFGYDPGFTFGYLFSILWGAALVIFALVWGYFIGLVAWPIFVTMTFIKDLSDHFVLEIQPSHPDKCGGLKPLGDFCFAMSLPVILGGISLAFVGVAGLALSLGDSGINLYLHYGICPVNIWCTFDPLLSYISLVLFIFIFTPLIIASFFLPLWKIHQFMTACKREAEDEFANRISGLEDQISILIDKESGSKQARIIKEKLEIFQTLNPNTLNYPIWPFRRVLLIQVLSPQILSIVGLGISLYEILKD